VLPLKQRYKLSQRSTFSLKNEPEGGGAKRPAVGPPFLGFVF
jgi:hypothetical protein